MQCNAGEVFQRLDDKESRTLDWPTSPHYQIVAHLGLLIAPPFRVEEAGGLGFYSPIRRSK